MAGALIVTAEMGPEDLAWFDRLRRIHFPPERNFLAAHLTMFHALPPSAEGQVKRVLSELSRRSPPRALLGEPYSLGRGVAFRIKSEELERLREGIADHFHGELTQQDKQGWRPHVTIQNKVDPAVARETLALLKSVSAARPVIISGLGLHRYLGGPWEDVARYPFRG